MFASFVLAFRETLEAALVIRIVLGVLNKTGRQYLKSQVSALAAWGFTAVAGGFMGKAEEVFEGVAMARRRGAFDLHDFLDDGPEKRGRPPFRGIKCRWQGKAGTN